MEPTNNARIKCMNLYAPIYAYFVHNKEQGIWRGRRVVEPGTPTDSFTEIYFVRANDPLEPNEMPEYEFEKGDLIGFPFLLIPKGNMLFGYDAPGTIIKPNILLQKPSPFNN